MANVTKRNVNETLTLYLVTSGRFSSAMVVIYLMKTAAYVKERPLVAEIQSCACK